eukprot:TRINITY_DN13092_c0_g1_i1.p1 TRINITY_DN13092_c0_g1~~TRINITY_DN13092_c0_g1_i1.p1  ORF type:complete len:301 (-),score=87.63 TRINITY_DN13092_c0_g1_i1:38-940(-)
MSMMDEESLSDTESQLKDVNIESPRPVKNEDTPTPTEDQTQPTASGSTEGSTPAKGRFGMPAMPAMGMGNLGFNKMFQVAKERVMEKMGKAHKTEDPVLAEKIKKLDDVKQQYDKIIAVGKKYVEQTIALNNTTRSLGALFTTFSVNDTENTAGMMMMFGNAQSEIATQNEVILQKAERFFGTITTFRDKAIEDALETIKRYESARVEFDTYQNKYGATEENPKSTKEQIEDSRLKMEKYKAIYEKANRDTDQKLTHLNEIRIMDMNAQIETFVHHLGKHFTGTGVLLEQISTQTDVAQE